MIRPPLDSEGVKLKVSELHSLQERDLILFDEIIKSNFKMFINSNFDLTDNQNLFIESLDDETIAYIRELCALCIRERLEITFISEYRRNNSYRKWLDVISNIKTSTSGTGLLRFEGSLAFVITYKNF